MKNTNTFLFVRCVCVVRRKVDLNRLPIIGPDHRWSICFSSEHIYFKKQSCIKNYKTPLSGQSSINIQLPLWTGNASILWRVMLSTAVKFLFVSFFFFFDHAHMLVVVYFCQVKQYPCSTTSWMLALMCSSYCGVWVSSALLWPVRRKRVFLQGPASVALGRNNHFPCRQSCCCLELRNARNVHNCLPFFFQTLSFMPLFSPTFLMGLLSGW